MPTAVVVFSCLFATVAGVAHGENVKANQPNVLIIMADDCTYNDLPLYGGENAVTPNIDSLAKQGTVFNRAYLAEAMCQPCRAELYSGLFPMRNGCAWNHSASLASVTSMPQHLKKLGYRVGLAGKVHVKPKKAFPFEAIPGFEKGCVKDPTSDHDVGGIKEFFKRKSDQPFCMVVALVEPHVPWVMGDASKYPPAELKLPPHIADTEKTREDFSAYLAEITYMDNQVGDILDTLEESGVADNTLVLFTSEQGSQFPGCKWTNWDVGVHTALVARWPGKVSEGKRTDAIVQYADVLPTLIELGGGAIADDQFDGKSFAKVLTGETEKHREYAYGVHNNIPEGPAYPIRTVTNGTFRYIRNLRPDEIYIEKHLMGKVGGSSVHNAYWASWPRDAWNKPEVYKLVKRYMSRPAEELYHTADDAFEMKNLALDPAYADIKKQLSNELDRWMQSQHDPGADQDTHEAHRSAKQGKHLYGPHLSGKSEK